MWIALVIVIILVWFMLPRRQVARIRFLSDAECDHLKALGSSRLQRSTVLGEESVSEHRTSKSAFLKRAEDDTVRTIEERASRLARCTSTQMEPMQVLRYRPGQEFKPHHDYFYPNEKGLEALKSGGQRVTTIFACISDDFDGGETEFPLLKQKFKLNKGEALVWKNYDGSEIASTLHAGRPVTRGEKWGLNIWTRQHDF